MVNWNQPGILLEEVWFFKKNRFVDGRIFLICLQD